MAPRPRAYAYGASAEASLRRAKELVDTVIVLMQELTRSLEGALEAGVGRCRQVRELLAWYQAQMSQYHVRGLQIAHLLSEDDMELVEEYAQAQVSSFSAELEAVVSDAADECSVSTTAFLPDVPAAALPPAAPLGVYAPPMVGFSGLSQRRAAGRESLVARAKERVQKLKAELLAAEGAAEAPGAAAADAAAATDASADAYDSKIAQEQAEVSKLKEQVAQLLARRSTQSKA